MKNKIQRRYQNMKGVFFIAVMVLNLELSRLSVLAAFVLSVKVPLTDNHLTLQARNGIPTHSPITIT